MAPIDSDETEKPLLARLEDFAKTLPQEGDRYWISLTKGRHRVTVLIDVSADSWKSWCLPALLRTFFPKSQGGQEGTRIPTGWLLEMDRRCPPDLDAPDAEKAAKKIVEEIVLKNERIANNEQLRARVRYVYSVFVKERPRLRG